MITKTRVSVLAMLVILGVSIMYIFNVGLHIKTIGAKHATITVPDTNGILVGSRVLLRGIEIGHVTDISQSVEGARITWDYGKSTKIPVASRYRVDNLSALGEAYVSVLPTATTGPYLQNNAQVDTGQVEVTSTFKDLSEQVTKILTQVDADKVQDVFRELDAGLPEDIEVLDNLNKAGTAMTKQLLRNQDSLRTLLQTMQPLLMRSGPLPQDLRELTPKVYDFTAMFTYMTHGVKDAIDWSGPMVIGINEGATPLVAMLQKFLDGSSGDIKVIGDNLLPLTSAGAASLRTIDTGKLLDQLIASANGGALTIRIAQPNNTGGR
ncbi:MCE family protein [Gordonia pseudamarae]|jgi:phospholipid/cholesterol/gamma-HCH transport system substrate-binding protein|uniref:MCE family protein n=1 Tax=Gordonia pseudamarae TaxID=2831662 RepID=A0ABX6INN0_9ACTN|nr:MULTISPECIES: MlaD family protein [Gordonia]MBD0024557.1 MCE family protein [Gordonia sp. (in: high G+C Gram-positive bacteria)]QHN27903.1 MCE family protein [Gordonia pseudamarae]QHN36760.1 MCE family protein [Gordonia pseudamarae]